MENFEKSSFTGKALTEAMQASPCRDVPLAPSRWPMRVSQPVSFDLPQAGNRTASTDRLTP